MVRVQPDGGLFHLGREDSVQNRLASTVAGDEALHPVADQFLTAMKIDHQKQDATFQWHDVDDHQLALERSL